MLLLCGMFGFWFLKESDKLEEQKKNGHDVLSFPVNNFNLTSRQGVLTEVHWNC